VTSVSEREAFLLWMSSSEKSERERIVIRKEAISTLEKVIEEQSRDVAHRSSLTCTLRKWRGMVAREQGNWAGARFEFLQGRSLAESYDPGNVPWFDAAITEAEVWEAFGMSGLELGGLKELVEKLDRTSGLYGMAGDRSNEEFTADWVRWFRFFLVPAVPTPTLVARVVDEVKRLRPEPEPGEAPTTRSVLGGYLFLWNYFWFSALTRQTEVLLRGVFAEKSTMDILLRGASVLVPPAGNFEPLLKPEIYRKQESPMPESPDGLLERIETDLKAFHAVEKDVKEYVSKVQGLWGSSTDQKRREVQRVMHPVKQRR
jgi:hypothetical protein